jgi:hypothetical protein
LSDKRVNSNEEWASVDGNITIDDIVQHHGEWTLDVWKSFLEWAGLGDTHGWDDDDEQEQQDEEDWWPVELTFGVLFVFVLLAALWGAAAWTAAATAEAHPLNKNDNESQGKEADEDSEGGGAGCDLSNSVSVDGFIDKIISTNKLHNYPLRLKELARAFL